MAHGRSMSRIDEAPPLGMANKGLEPRVATPLAEKDWLGLPQVVARPAFVKGNLINSRARYVREQFGQGAVDALKQDLAEPALLYLAERHVVSNWYPYRPLMDLDRAIIAGPMQGDATKMLRFGAEIAFYDLNRVYRTLIKLMSPTFLLNRIGLAYSLYFRAGKMTSTQVDDCAVRITCVDDASARYMCTYGYTGWFCAAAEKAGAHGVSGEHTACQHTGGPHCEWTIRWRGVGRAFQPAT